MNNATFTIEKIVYGGSGLGRHEGRVWLVPGTAPGEVVKASCIHDRGNMIEGELQEIVDRSPSRRDPKCGYYTVCGGCQLQHLNYSEQVKAKTGFVSECLRKEKVELDFEPEVLPSPFEFGYRIRAQLAMENKVAGFLKRRSSEIIEVSTCPVLAKPLDDAIPRICESVRSKSGGSFPLNHLSLMCGERGEVASEPLLGFGFTSEASWTVNGYNMKCSPDVFFQANCYLLDAFMALVGEGRSGKTAIDLFGGIGFFSIQLARRFKSVIVVEENRTAVSYGKENAKAAGVSNVRFVPSKVEKLDPDDFGTPVDFVIADPPRAGLSNKAFGFALALKPESIAYISCDPVSLSKDIKKFVARGYKPSRISVLDMFPQTFHVETVAFLERG